MKEVKSFSSLYVLMNEIGSFTDCAIISDDINRRYFTGMKSSVGTLVVLKDKAYLIIDFRYIEKARKTVKECEVILQDDLFKQINQIINENECKKISLDESVVTLSQYKEYSSKINAEIDIGSELSDLIKVIREYKSGEEISSIIEAQRIAEKGFEHILEYVREGRSEKEIQLELDYYMLRSGADDLSFETIALSGEKTSMPHGVPGDRKVSKGEFVLLDFGAVVNGWHSDMTRTIAVGKPTEEMQKIYQTVLDAQIAGINAVKSGISGKDLDKVSRDIIDKSGYGKYFGHSLGHGVGMEIHESPYASPMSKDIIETDMIITIEPGIYLPDKFGVRIEDFVIVTEEGCFNLTKSSKNLIIL